jgi:hypothetical protein
MPHEVWISQTVAEEANRRAHIREASNSSSHGTQSAQRFGLVYQPKEGPLQPRLQQDDSRLPRIGHGSRCDVDFTTRSTDALADPRMRKSVPSLRVAI